MAKILRISEAASIGIHAALVLAAEDGKPVSVPSLARRLNASRAHCSKVLQRLTRNGYVKPQRGPSGGYVLNRDPSDIRLLDIYEAVEGPLIDTECLFQEEKCRFDTNNCLFEALLADVNRKVRSYFQYTLSEFAEGQFVDKKRESVDV